MLSYKNVITPRQWQATTGLSESKFWKLCEVFGQTYEEIHSVNLVQTSKNLKRKLLLPTYADCLYFVLFQLKNGLSFDTLGVLIETDDSNSKRNFEKYLSVLGHSLVKLGMLPKRNFETVEELETYLGNVGTILIDVTEQETERPKDAEIQKSRYSGKKKRPTYKELIITNNQRFILYVSPSYDGKVHDMTLLKTEFPPNKGWFVNFEVFVDLGFQGIASLYVGGIVMIPYKRRRVKKGFSNELTDEQKQYNKEVGKQRIVVEHSIGGMKRYQILVRRNRCKSNIHLNDIVVICAGLWNFSITT